MTFPVEAQVPDLTERVSTLETGQTQLRTEVGALSAKVVVLEASLTRVESAVSGVDTKVDELLKKADERGAVDIVAEAFARLLAAFTEIVHAVARAINDETVVQVVSHGKDGAIALSRTAGLLVVALAIIGLVWFQRVENVSGNVAGLGSVSLDAAESNADTDNDGAGDAWDWDTLDTAPPLAPEPLP